VTHAELFSLLPLLILGLSSIIILLASAFLKRVVVSFSVCMIGLISALIDVCLLWQTAPGPTAILVISRFSLFAIGLILCASIVTAASALHGLRARKNERGEYFFLLTLASLGASILAAAGSFISLFLGLELLSVSLFTLIAYPRERISAGEAGIKYLILGGVSSAFLLFGMALVYFELGSMEISGIGMAAATAKSLLLYTGLGLMTVGIGFKLAVVPFHLWTPDVYDGAPSHVSGFLATASKGAAAVILVRLFGPGGIDIESPLGIVFAVISGATMFVGNLLALREGNVKRILAYSSIANLGYLLIAFIAGGSASVVAVGFFLAAYFASTLSAFTSVAVLSGEREADQIEDYRGLARRKPWRAACFTLSLISLAGLPLTAGFMGKFMIFIAGEGALLWVLAVLLAVNSTISLVYYLRVISTMYATPQVGREAAPGKTTAASGDMAPDTSDASPSIKATAGRAAVPFLAAVVLALTTLAILALGVYPSWLLRVIELSSRG
jgi:NADH-quinone oxidoreductase subunit N